MLGAPARRRPDGRTGPECPQSHLRWPRRPAPSRPAGPRRRPPEESSRFKGGGSAPKSPKEEAAAPAAAPVPAAPAEKSPRKERPDRPGRGHEAKDKDSKPGKGGKTGKAGAPEAAPKGRKKPIPDNPNFRYIVRLAGSDLDGTRSAGLALTGVAGVGARISNVACRMAGVNPAEMIGNLPEATVDGIEKLLESLAMQLPRWMVNHPADYATGESRHYIGPSLDTARRDDVNLLRMVRSYKGVRHERGQKVRGQRTRSNGRTGMAAGVLKKAAKEAAATKATETAAADKKKA
ncbi:MAG: 30S ribosomal protein S13 [Thermoplasmata archaeon]